MLLPIMPAPPVTMIIFSPLNVHYQVQIFISRVYHSMIARSIDLVKWRDLPLIPVSVFALFDVEFSDFLYRRCSNVYPINYAIESFTQGR